MHVSFEKKKKTQYVSKLLKPEKIIMIINNKYEENVYHPHHM